MTTLYHFQLSLKPLAQSLRRQNDPYIQKKMLGFIKIVAIFATLFICQQNHLASGQLSLKKLKTVAEWKELEFQFPLPEDKNLALLSGKYVPGNAVPIDVQVDYKGGIQTSGGEGDCCDKSVILFCIPDRGQTRLFVTIPRFQTGIPITFGSLTSIPGNGGPIIQPYPDYTWHSSHGANCDGITSVFRIAVGRLINIFFHSLLNRFPNGMIINSQFPFHRIE